MNYEVWQTGVSARISSHRKLETAASARQRAASKFRRSRDYNPGSLIGFEIRRSDGEPLTPAERATVARIDEDAAFGR